MISFVDSRVLFSNEQERTIDHLSSYYNNPEELDTIISEIIYPHLTPTMIKGKKILLKPNLVLQCKNPYDDICLFTHPNFILSTLRVLLACSPLSIVIGDAPIQDCHWDELLPEYFYEGVNELIKKFNVPIKVVDFRKVVFDHKLNQFGKSKRTEDDYLIFDVGDRSYLEPITEEKNRFRVTNYDPNRMALSHAKGMHKFCVAKEVFEADIVITMPKTKTHRMACITNSLKILVGMNGDKDYLPHHRIGSTSQGGDCYKDTNLFRTLTERILDFANKHRGSFFFRPLHIVSGILWRLSKPTPEYSINAGWYGNDTVWRMVMDLNTIAHYGKLDGTLAEEKQRIMYTLCDGIIGGQKSGPLEPDPLALGIVSFSNDPYLMDEMAGYMFGLEIDKVPLLREAARLNITKEINLVINGEKATRDDFKKLSTTVELAPGWINYNKV